MHIKGNLSYLTFILAGTAHFVAVIGFVPNKVPSYTPPTSSCQSVPTTTSTTDRSEYATKFRKGSNLRVHVQWDGSTMSQLDFMEKDTVLVVDEDDNVIGSESKRASHEFNLNQPIGVTHRAFSVFIFDQTTNELLLQQRAKEKITFPSVWTNTCCSHPLHGMDPSEVDTPADVASGTVPGVKHAAVRKLEHELGIPPAQLPIENFKFLTRLHYWAADTVTHGPDSPWGEQEIDYILFFVVNSKEDITLRPNGEEVDDVKWVTQSKLKGMMDDTSLLFSPWFRIIAKKWVMGENKDKGGWWNNLQETMGTDKHCDYEVIHRFDPPEEHMGGLGNAGSIFEICS